MIIKQLNGPVGGVSGGASVSYKQAVETIDLGFTNAQGATITLGFPVAITTTAASVDGKLAVLPAASNLTTFYGIALRSVPNNSYGLARSYGFIGSVAIFAAGTSVTINASDPMGPGPASLGVSSLGLKTAFGPVLAMEAIGAAINSPGGYARGFVRAM